VKLKGVRKRSDLIALLLLALAVDANSRSSAVPAAEWKRLASPEQAGWSAENLVAMVDGRFRQRSTARN